jgi:hypothetical protein
MILNLYSDTFPTIGKKFKIPQLTNRRTRALICFQSRLWTAKKRCGWRSSLSLSALHPRGGSGISGAEKSVDICEAVEHGCGKGQAHLLGCLGPEAQGLCKVMAEVGGEGPEGLKSIYESLSMGLCEQSALRIEHMMKPRLYGGPGLGVEEVRGLG